MSQSGTAHCRREMPPAGALQQPFQFLVRDLPKAVQLVLDLNVFPKSRPVDPYAARYHHVRFAISAFPSVAVWSANASVTPQKL